VDGTSTLQRREEESFYTPRTSRWELASKNWNIRFWKLEHTKFKNIAVGAQTGPPPPIFPGLVRCGVCVTIVFHSSHLRF
jgi:hypothetical protein